jgi:hypothetical protein
MGQAEDELVGGAFLEDGAVRVVEQPLQRGLRHSG